MLSFKTIKFLGAIITLVALAIFFAPLVYLSFFNHPSSDDYFGAHVSMKYDMGPYIQHVRQTWGSRYLSYFFTKSFANNYFLFRHYSAHSLILLAANALSCVFLFSVINRYLFVQKKSLFFVAIAALFYMALQLTCLPETWSAYYWLSGAYNHQTGILLMHVEVAMFIVYFNVKSKAWRGFAAFAVALLVALINGVNETIILCNGALLGLLFLLLGKKKDSLFIALAALIYLATMYFVVSAPGNSTRTENIPRAGIAKAIIVSVGRMLYCFWNLFLNPLFWVVSTCVFVAAKRFKLNYARFNFNTFITKNKLALLLLPFVIILAVLVPVMYVSNGSMPERTNNVLAQFAIILLLFTFVFIGGFYQFTFNRAKAKYVLATILVLCLFCNRNFGEWVKSSISAKLYDDVLTRREQILQHAKDNNIKQVSLAKYEAAADSLILTKYQNEKKMVQLLMVQRPATIASDDDLNTQENRDNLKNYYHLDSINVVK